ncbi:DUF484 family protein [Parahaliea sp. F7430]|uniref:DUF484 family protein n=1 Tax=Sediminihaliea albiluteola TaxID=2758564 RepID=A0A7W2TWL9_9GAMM|nr:DUF484 family protein [Sediminihaliea albiluteola]MBA6413290.1 DUF484 family protein [Sediminihaliea albiluteola]
MPASNDAAARNNDKNNDSALNDEQVREHLKSNSDFFQRHPDMLDSLQVSHASGSAVSLVEKQISVLRERNTELRHRLNALTATAHDNDKLYDRTRHLVLKLLESKTLSSLCDTFASHMRDSFEVEHASMILFGDPAESSAQIRFEAPETVKLEIGGLLNSRKPLCGVLRETEFGFLFPTAGELGSAAVMPLSDADGNHVGVIAIGSSDASRYHSGMGTLFLLYIADVLVRLMAHLPTANSA